MMSVGFGALTVTRKSGTERFHMAKRHLPFCLLDFWQWSASDLVSNAMRGVLAEYLVAQDLGLAGGVRVEWDAYDLKTANGVKVEVKSAAYLQTWYQAKPSAISFGIQPTIGWDASTNEYATTRQRQADIYVFAVLHHLQKATLDPLDMDQWEFYVLPASVLNERVPEQKRISLATLLLLKPIAAKFGEVSAAIEGLYSGSPA